MNNSLLEERSDLGWASALTAPPRFANRIAEWRRRYLSAAPEQRSLMYAQANQSSTAQLRSRVAALTMERDRLHRLTTPQSVDAENRKRLVSIGNALFCERVHDAHKAAEEKRKHEEFDALAAADPILRFSR